MPESTKPHTQRRRPGTRNPTGCGGPGGRFGVAPRASAGVRGAVSVVRGGNLPAAVQSIVPGGGGRGARDVAQLSDRELRVELAVSSAWVSYLRLMIDPESRRERQLPTRGGAGHTASIPGGGRRKPPESSFCGRSKHADRRLFCSGDRAAAADP